MKEITKEIKDYLLSIGYPDKEKIFYLEVWLWLWREKNIHIAIIDSKVTTQCYTTINNEKDSVLFNSPEEAIVSAIEYLSDNDLIK